MAESKARKGFFARMVRFLKDVKAEMKKVIWPSRNQVANNTGIVLAVIAIIGTLIWVLDAGFTSIAAVIL